MACTCPVDAWHPRDGVEDRRLKFSPLGADDSRHLLIPCGRCNGCLGRRSQDWGVRVAHEVQMAGGVACFVTRTYDAEHLPADWSVSRPVHQCFMKRLRFLLDAPVRNFSCGEYGDSLRRPHYHDILIGEDFSADRVPLRKSQSGGLLYTSPRLTKAWPFGEAAFSAFTLDTAFYVAKYNVKHIRADAGLIGSEARDVALKASLFRCDSATGREWHVAPPFLAMSRMPGLGFSWFDRFGGDAFPADFVVLDGRKFPVPAYYLKLLERSDDGAAELLRERRRLDAFKRAVDASERRLAARHESGLYRAARFAREFS